MATNNSKDKKRSTRPIVTAEGTCYYPHIFSPGEYEGKSTGYNITCVFDAKETKRLKKIVDDTIKEAQSDPQFDGKKWDRPLYPYTETDADDDVFEGAVTFKFKKNDSYKDKKTDEVKQTAPPAVFDTKGTPVPYDPRMASGSVVRIAFRPQAYWASKTVYGVRFQLVAVQLVNVKTWQVTAESLGFDALDDGYVAPAAQPVEDHSASYSFDPDEDAAAEDGDF